MAKLEAVTLTAKNGARFVLRSPLPGEGAKIIEVVTVILGKSEHLLSEADEFNYTVDQEEQLIRSHLDHPAQILIVPEVSGRLVGMFNFTLGTKRRISHVGDLGISLLPEFRGLGIGKALLQTFVDWARANPQIEKVNLRVHEKNVEAAELYKKLGFRVEGREIKAVKLASGTYDNVLQMALFVK